MRLRTPRSTHLSALVLTGLLAGLLAGLPAPPAHAAAIVQPLPPIPLTAVTAPGSATGTAPNGDPRAYWVSSGSPSSILSVVDPRTGERLETYPLPSSGGSWAVDAQPDGDVYIGTYGSGLLYRYDADRKAVENLGNPFPGETFIWATTHDERGVIYSGTGPREGHVWSYDPTSGATRDYGSFGTSDKPLVVHGVAAGNGKIYAGTGAEPTLTEIDAATGERTPIPLPAGIDQDYVYDLDLRGGLLFMRASSAGAPEPLHVYDVQTRAWIDAIPGVHGLRMSQPSPDGRATYFVKDQQLHRYDLQSRTWAATGLTGISDVRGFGFVDLKDPAWPGQTLIGTDYTAGYFRYHPGSGRSDRREADVAGAATPIRAMAEGPDRKVYFTGYLGGGLASYDPATHTMAKVSAMSQAESLTTHDGALYAGTYPRAAIVRYRPEEPVVEGVNPKTVLDLYDEGQSRPWALESAGRYLAIGTVPHNGSLGGALSILDTTTGEHWTQTIAGGHSVVGLTYRDGILYGATSVYGGAGAPRPANRDAVVFAYDIDERRVLWQLKPQAGEGAFGELAFDDEGYLWTGGPMSVFKIDVTSPGVVASRSYGDYPWDSIDYAWVSSRVWVDPYDGQLYVGSQGAFYSVNRTTLERVRHFRPASFGFMANDGYNYVGRDLAAWQWSPASRPRVEVDLSTTSVSRGQRLTVTVSGLGPGEPVAVWHRPTGTSLGEVRADGAGTARASRWISMDEPLGAAAIEISRPLTGGLLRAAYTVSDVRCDATIRGSVQSVRVATGTTCITGANVRDGVVVAAGAGVVVRDSTVQGGISASGATLLSIERSSVLGGATTTASTGVVHLSGNQIRGGVTVTDSQPPAAVITGNVVWGDLVCTGNTAAPTLSSNTLHGKASGQCLTRR